ncbi:MAG: hypothetical protein FD153_1034 [Rhodospirillaceae bacterium]|nr:MAG: hypothetical protein FD153_1034 [Rhodospirillaceae bacterium]
MQWIKQDELWNTFQTDPEIKRIFQGAKRFAYILERVTNEQTMLNIGIGDALVEGLAAGLPVVAFADVSGVAELIRPNETGLLAESELAFAQALARLMEDAALRTRLGTAARQSVERFHPAAIDRRWQELVARTGEQHDRPHPS